MQYLDDICMAQRSRGKSKQNKNPVKPRKEIQKRSFWRRFFSSFLSLLKEKRPPEAKRRTDSHASDVGHWLGMTPLRGVWADGHKGCGGQMAGGVPQGHSFRFAPQRRTPPLHTKFRTAQLCISEQKRQRSEEQRQCNISVKFPRHNVRVAYFNKTEIR